MSTREYPIDLEYMVKVKIEYLKYIIWNYPLLPYRPGCKTEPASNVHFYLIIVLAMWQTERLVKVKKLCASIEWQKGYLKVRERKLIDKQSRQSPV